MTLQEKDGVYVILFSQSFLKLLCNMLFFLLLLTPIILHRAYFIMYGENKNGNHQIYKYDKLNENELCLKRLIFFLLEGNQMQNNTLFF